MLFIPYMLFTRHQSQSDWFCIKYNEPKVTLQLTRRQVLRKEFSYSWNYISTLIHTHTRRCFLCLPRLPWRLSHEGDKQNRRPQTNRLYVIWSQAGLVNGNVTEPTYHLNKSVNKQLVSSSHHLCIPYNHSKGVNSLAQLTVASDCHQYEFYYK